MSTETPKPTTAVAKPYDIVAETSATLRRFTESRELMLPADYSVENALKAAWLTLQETVDKDKKPALTVCSQASISNALLDMAVQGLNPGKKQCYFIAYGAKLLCQRSYFGTIAVAKRVAHANDVWAEVVYEKDVFEYEIRHNRKVVTNHQQKLENVDGTKIIAAYCVVEFDDKREPHTEIMTMVQIRKAWSKSKMNPDADGSTHKMYPEEMSKRTVTNRACKAHINSSSDNALFLSHFNRAEDEGAEDEIAAEIEQNANKTMLDVSMNRETGEIIHNLNANLENLEVVEGERDTDGMPVGIIGVDQETGEIIEKNITCPECESVYLATSKQAEAIDKTGQCISCHNAELAAEAEGQEEEKAGPGF